MHIERSLFAHEARKQVPRQQMESPSDVDVRNQEVDSSIVCVCRHCSVVRPAFSCECICVCVCVRVVCGCAWSASASASRMRAVHSDAWAFQNSTQGRNIQPSPVWKQDQNAKLR